jgi:hypothetical protein
MLSVHLRGQLARNTKMQSDGSSLDRCSNQLANLEVRECKASNFQDCDLVFSGLDSDVAGDIGMLPLLHGAFNI